MYVTEYICIPSRSNDPEILHSSFAVGVRDFTDRRELMTGTLQSRRATDPGVWDGHAYDDMPEITIAM